MDTNDLTDMAYACIGVADEAVDVLKSEIGAGCSHYSSEDAYLKSVLAYVRDIEDEPEDYLDSWLMLEETDVPEFRVKLRALCEHIEKTLATPIAERGEPDFL